MDANDLPTKPEEWIVDWRTTVLYTDNGALGAVFQFRTLMEDDPEPLTTPTLGMDVEHIRSFRDHLNELLAQLERGGPGGRA